MHAVGPARRKAIARGATILSLLLVTGCSQTVRSGSDFHRPHRVEPQMILSSIDQVQLQTFRTRVQYLRGSLRREASDASERKSAMSDLRDLEDVQLCIDLLQHRDLVGARYLFARIHRWRLHDLELQSLVRDVGDFIDEKEDTR